MTFRFVFSETGGAHRAIVTSITAEETGIRAIAAFLFGGADGGEHRSLLLDGATSRAWVAIIKTRAATSAIRW